MVYSEVTTPGTAARIRVRGERKRSTLEEAGHDAASVLANVPGVKPGTDGLPPLDVAAFGSSI